MRSVVHSLLLMVLSMVLLGSAGLAQSNDPSAGQHVKNAGHETKQATKKTAHKVKHGTKKATHKAANETRKGSEKVEKKTEPQPQ